MKTLAYRLAMLATLIFTCMHAQTAYSAGLMMPVGSDLTPLEIREHHVEVVIEDGYAITSVEQIFANPNTRDLEAIYSFPVPDGAAVGEFTFWIDGEAVSGEVLEKERARDIYEGEKQAGREAAITEQDAYRTFDISVYPVRAGQDAYVRLTYIQPVHVDSSIGRYVYPLEEGGVDEEKISFWTYHEDVQEQFSFNLEFRSSWPVDEFRLPMHPQAAIRQTGADTWQVSMGNGTGREEQVHEPASTDDSTAGMGGSNGPAHRLDEDIVVYWRQAQGLPGSVELVAYKERPDGRGTFMMTVTPGDDLGPITEGRDWLFILDISGSMDGKFHSLLEGVDRGLNSLDPGDRFRIFLFNRQAHELTPGFEYATAANVRHYLEAVSRVQPGSGTNLYAGLELGMDALDADRSSALVLVTDGVANVGLTERRDFLDLLEKHDVRLFTFVMGNSANRPLLESMANVSNGFAMNVSNSDDIAGKLMEATSKLTHEALHDVDVRFSGVKVRDLTPERIGSLYRGQQLVIFGHYWGEGEATVILDGRISGHDRSYTTTFEFPRSAALHPEIERLWAFAKIEDLQQQLDYFGEGADLEQAITDIAVENGLVTDYTSMIVLRNERFEELGIQRLNKARVEKELLARQERSLRSVRDNRVDQQQPMYSQPRANHSNGGGALGPWTLLLLLPLLLLRAVSIPRSR
jgi:Ca-activated chloride channel family protein